MPSLSNSVNVTLANAKAGESGGLFGVLAGAAVGFAQSRIGTPKPPAPWYKQSRYLEIGAVLLVVGGLIVLIKVKK